MKQFVLCAYINLFIFFALGAVAAAFPAPKSMHEKELRYRGKSYVVKVGNYSPPSTVTPIVKSQAKYDTPEDAIVNFITAIKLKDFDFFFSNWTESSKVLNTQRNVSMNRTREYWIKRWSLAEGKPFEVNCRADYTYNGKHIVFIGYSIKGIMADGKDLNADMAFEKEKGRWLGSQSTQADPVFNNLYKICNSTERLVLAD
jgi:hypothetical protein